MLVSEVDVEPSQCAEAVEVLVREHRRRYELPTLEVQPNDEMYQWSVRTCATPAMGHFAYFRSGLVIADTLRQIVDGHLGADGGRILDFACGYGRSLRYSVQDFGADRVWACEILPEALPFARDVLGAHAVASTTDPGDIKIDERFDVIFVSSLFTHLPKSTFDAWLTALHSLLTPRGLLVASVHDETLLPPGQELDEDGFWFQPLSEIETLDPQAYGATVVTASFMDRAIRSATGMDRYRRFPTALCFDQDVYLIPASTDAVLSVTHLTRGAQGAVDSAGMKDGNRFVAWGWAATQDLDDSVRDVELRIDGQFVATVAPTSARPDVDAALHRAGAGAPPTGWSCDVTMTNPPRPNAVVTAHVNTSRGRRDIVWAFPLGPPPEAAAGQERRSQRARQLVRSAGGVLHRFAGETRRALRRVSRRLRSARTRRRTSRDLPS